MAVETQRLNWANRTTLHSRQMVYAFSLNMSFSHDTNGGDGTAEQRDEFATFHVLKRTQVETVDGGIHNLPRFRVSRGLNNVRPVREAVVELSNSLWIKDEYDADVVVRCRGVCEIPGGLRRLFLPKGEGELFGTSFVSVRTESSETKYRWLVTTQLLGFGRAKVTREKGRDQLRFAVEYDLYSAI